TESTHQLWRYSRTAFLHTVSPADSNLSLGRGDDVLIEPEDILRIVPALDSAKPIEDAPICVRHSLIVIVADEVHVGATIHEWLECLEGRSSPRDLALIVRRDLPGGGYVEQPRSVAVAERRALVGNRCDG